MTKQDKEKLAFAKAMLSVDMNPLRAGRLVHPNDFNRAAQIASTWHNDEEVLALVKEFQKEIYTKSGKDEDDVYLEKKLKEAAVKADTWRDRIRALEVYAEVRGKKKQNSQNVTVLMPKVIMTSEYSTDKDKWEADLVTQQENLLNASRSKH